MNEKNLEYLKKNLKYLGFDPELNGELDQKILEELPEFRIWYRKSYGMDLMVAELHFRRSEQSGRYFLNKYGASLQNESDPGRSRSQVFYVDRENRFTLKEAYNLLSGRAVFKNLVNREAMPYNAWVQLDFQDPGPQQRYRLKLFHTNYGFDLERVLKDYPIRELQEEQDKARLIRSLEKGNLQSVVLERNGRMDRAFIEANPQFKTINLFDQHLNRLHREAFRLDAIVLSEGVQEPSSEPYPLPQNKNQAGAEGPGGTSGEQIS